MPRYLLLFLILAGFVLLFRVMWLPSKEERLPEGKKISFQAEVVGAPRLKGTTQVFTAQVRGYVPYL